MNQQTITITSGTLWAILMILARWLLFRKAGKPAWHSLIPILNAYDEFDICWKGGKIFLLALLAAVAAVCGFGMEDNPVFMAAAGVAVLWILIIHWRQSMKLAKAFGKGTLYGIFLFFFDKLARLILGLGGAKYDGNP